MDSCIVGIYWGSRQESTYQLSEKVLKTLIDLSSIDSQFGVWYETAYSRKSAMKKSNI